MKLLALLLMSFSFCVYSQTVSFERGNTMSMVEMEGRLFIQCRDSGGGTDSYSYSCYQQGLVGGDYGAIKVTDGSIDADWVKLQREGSRYIKGAKFDSTSGTTGYHYNLWIRSLLQRPLLQLGENKIKYTFTKNRQVVKEGEFTVIVTNTESRQCNYDSMYYGGYCPSYSEACGNYFRRQNYCK